MKGITRGRRADQVEISQLQAFLAVAEELHFGRAAEKLHRAQPPLSRTIKQLERELDTELFSRSTRAVKLTASGEALVGPARDVLDALRRAEAAVRAADDGDVGLVRIAFAGASTHQLVARLARVVRSQRPGIQLELSSQNFAQPAMKKLVSGETDIALGRWDIVPAEVAVRVVMQDSLVVALPDTHPLAGEQRLSIARFAAEGFVSLPPHEGAVLPDRLRRLARAGYTSITAVLIYTTATIVMPILVALAAVSFVGISKGWVLALVGAAIGYLLPGCRDRRGGEVTRWHREERYACGAFSMVPSRRRDGRRASA